MKRHDDVFAEVPSSMTRVCRAKFERDDLDEAMIICGLQDSLPRDVEAQSPSGQKRKIGNSDTRQGPVKRTGKSATWRVPRLFPFNYTMSPPRVRSNSQRRSIPFENTGVHYAPLRVESPEATDYRATVLAHTTKSNNDKSGSLVSPRPPHPRWNDESDPDHPYDNPYYSRPIRNSLWLPRNPCGLLDLDDTIDLSEALTSSENSGDLGSWVVGSRSLPPDFQPSLLEHLPGNMASVPPETIAATMPPRYSGNEKIVFPPHSASGVHSSNDHQVSQPERHSSVYRLRGHSCHSRSQTTPTTASWPPINSFHSEGRPFFDSSTRSASQPIVGWNQSSTPRDPELVEIAGKLPGVNASAELLTSSQRRPRDHMAEASTVTLAEAVAREAVVEERKVLDESIRKEEAEAEDNANTRTRPWWMGFFFSRAAT
jgi:hypothetical protein